MAHRDPLVADSEHLVADIEHLVADIEHLVADIEHLEARPGGTGWGGAVPRRGTDAHGARLGRRATWPGPGMAEAHPTLFFSCR